MKDSLLIYSGGMDSSVLLYEYQKNIQLAISFNYGSKHNFQEIKHAKINCDKLKIEHKIIDISNIFNNIKSDLLNSGGDIPEGHYEDESMKKTVVPFRNGIMLSIATGIAESEKLKIVMIANHAGDHVIYPDCRKNFIISMSDAIKYGTWGNIILFAPYTLKTKREIALTGKDLNIDFNNTYSCYKGHEIHCGICGTCTERKEALNEFDTTVYKK